MGVDNNGYKMRVLVTGATGFIGKYVIDELLRVDCSIIIAARSMNVPAGWLHSHRITIVHFDFEDFKGQKNYFDHFNQPDKLIHLAWQGLPNYKALFHIEKNLYQHYFFLKNLIENGLSSLTVTGTCFEYGMQEGCLREDMPARPNNPYALGKHTLHCFLQELKKHYSFRLNWTRLFYMYGKGQAPNSLFSQLLAAIDRGDEVFNMSGGEQERDFLPVEEVAKNIVRIALAKEEIGLINCCSGQPIKVKDWVADFIQLNNANLKMNLGYYSYPDYEPMRFWGDSSRLKLLEHL